MLILCVNNKQYEKCIEIKVCCPILCSFTQVIGF